MKIKLGKNSIIALCTWLFLFCSCQDEEQMKSVDLRYNPQESYLFSAKASGESFSFQVKSTDMWKIYGKSDWCMITPDQGEPGKVYDISITCKENTALDDREDIITVQSDYWIGTTFTVIQKGTAFLNAAPADGREAIAVPKEGGSGKISIKSNQKWTLQIPEDVTWLQADKLAGEQNGEITLTVSERNMGEQRECFISVLDRNGKGDSSVGVRVIQEGVLLVPGIAYSRVKAGGETIRVQVESNADWTVSKGNSDDAWYGFDNTEFSGNGEIAIIVGKNGGQDFREADIILQTKVVEGVTPVKKKLRIKQGYSPKGKKYTFDANDWWVDAGTPQFADGSITLSSGGEITITRNDVGKALGTYSFHVSSIAGNNTTVSTVYVFKPWTVINWGVWSGGSTGWTSLKFESEAPGLEPGNIEINPVYPCTLTMQLIGTDEGGVSLEWLIDEQTVGKYTMKKIDFDVDFQSVGYLKLKCAGGECVLDYFEYAPPLNWGDEEIN